MRTPSRMNHDITLFKNFAICGDRRSCSSARACSTSSTRAFAATVDRQRRRISTLDTRVQPHVDNVPNGVGGYADGVCDPTGGYSFTDVTNSNFGKINILRGHRVIEFALKYYFLAGNPVSVRDITVQDARSRR